MKSWERIFTRGKYLLTVHKPKQALELFRSALEACPSTRRIDLTEIYFYMGISLNKLGYQACALKSWRAASRLGRDKHCEDMIRRMSNSNPSLRLEARGRVLNTEDDQKTFLMIQKCKYLSTRRQEHFGSPAEKDMILDLINLAWENLTKRVDLSRLGSEEKKALFAAEVIIFPYLHPPAKWFSPSQTAKILPFKASHSRYSV